MRANRHRSLSVATVAAASLAGAAAACGPRPLLYEGRGDLAIEPIEVRLVRVTEVGFPDGPIRLVEGEGGVAFLNDTRDRAIEVVFPAHSLGLLRCSYTRGFGTDGRSTATVRPLPPGGVASICLHTAGAIPFEVRGIGPAPRRGRLDVAAARKETRP